MNRFTFLLLLLLPTLAFGQSGKPLLSFPTLADLEARSPVPGEVVEVRNGSAVVRWARPRPFIHYPSSVATPIPGMIVTNAAGSGRYEALDYGWPVHSLSDFMVVGDGIIDDQEGVNRAFNFGCDLEVPMASTFAMSQGMRLTNNYPFRLWISGGYDTEWLATNDQKTVTFKLTAPISEPFFDFTPASGLRYGLNLMGLTIDANSNAPVALKIKNNTRGQLVQVRPRNATEIAYLLENTTYIDHFGVSVSKNERPFVCPPKIGILVTNQSNANLFQSSLISGTTDWAFRIEDRSFQNRILNGGIESNLGAGLYFGAGCSLNEHVGTWYEKNGNTNRYILVEDGSFQNVIRSVKFENRIGKLYIAGGSTKVDNCSLGRLEFAVTAGYNRVTDTFLAIGQQPEGYVRFQNLQNLADAAALIRTNTVQGTQVFYGETPIRLWRDDEAYPRATIDRDGIHWGDGSSDPSVGFYKLSAASIGTANGLVQVMTGANDGLWSAYVTGDAQPRWRINIGGVLGFGPGGTNDLDTTWYRMAPGKWGTLAQTHSFQTNSADFGFAVAQVGDPYMRIAMAASGKLELGQGALPRDWALQWESPLTARAGPNLVIGNELTLGGVARSSWNTNADLLQGQNGAYYLNRTNHAGTQPHTTITGLGTLATIDDAPSDGWTHGRNVGSWVHVLPLTAGIYAPITGDLFLTNATTSARLLFRIGGSGMGMEAYYTGEILKIGTTTGTIPYSSAQTAVAIETNRIVTFSVPPRVRDGTYAYLTPIMGHAPGASAAALSTRNSKPIVAFDPTTEEHYRWTWVLPSGFDVGALSGADTLKFILHFTSSATTGNVRWVVRMQRLTGVDIDSDSFGSGGVANGTVSGTAGTVVTATTSNVGRDSSVAGDAVEIDVYRDVGNAGDTVDSDDAELVAIEVRNW